jgi:glutathione S-transferase
MPPSATGSNEDASMLEIYGHPFAAFYWKVLIALYERDVPFTFRMVDGDHPGNGEAVGRLAPTGQFPVLVDGTRTVLESAAIIEYLDLHHGAAPPLVPRDARAAIEARQMDGIFDDYVMTPLSRMVFNVIRAPDKRHAHLDAEMHAALDKAYAWLERWMAGRTWAANDTFGIADCAAAPALVYAHWGHPIPASCTALHAYRARLVARPSIARVIAEARPFRDFFPIGDRHPGASPWQDG